MRVGLIVPADTPPTGGNVISAQRLKEGLARLHVDATVDRWHPHLAPYDVYHAWNAVQVGQALVRQGLAPRKIVVTWTGHRFMGGLGHRPRPYPASAQGHFPPGRVYSQCPGPVIARRSGMELTGPSHSSLGG